MGPAVKTMNMAQIAREARVGRAAVANWRRRHTDFPQPVGGTPESPLFRSDEAAAWLRAHDKVADPEPTPPPATITLADGRTVELHLPHLNTHNDGYEELGGYVPIDTDMPWPRLTITRATVEDQEPFAVDDASIDISYIGSRSHKFVLIGWCANRRHAPTHSCQGSCDEPPTPPVPEF